MQNHLEIFSTAAKLYDTFNAHASHLSVRHFFGHNSPAAAAREVFKPSTDSASLVVPSQKKVSVLG